VSAAHHGAPLVVLMRTGGIRLVSCTRPGRIVLIAAVIVLLGGRRSARQESERDGENE
jgi:hypothetical protein